MGNSSVKLGSRSAGAYEKLLQHHPAKGGFYSEFLHRPVYLMDVTVRDTMNMMVKASSEGLLKDKDFHSLAEDYVQLTVTASDALEKLKRNLGKSKDELENLCGGLTNGNIGATREKANRWLTMVGYEFVNCYDEYEKQHKELVERFKQKAAALKKKQRNVKLFKKYITAIFVGFFAASVMVSVIAAALHAGPALLGLVSAAVSTASWGPLFVWLIDMRKRNEQTLSEVCYELDLQAEQGYIENEIKPIYDMIEELHKSLVTTHKASDGSSDNQNELLKLKKTIQDESASIDELLKEVNSCSDGINRRRHEFFMSMTRNTG